MSGTTAVCLHPKFVKVQQFPYDPATELDPKRKFALCPDCGFETSEQEGLRLMWSKTGCGVPGVCTEGICPELQVLLDAASTYLPTPY